MTSSKRYLAFLFCFVICLPVHANDLLEKHFDAIGGKERFLKVETIHRSGSVDGNGGGAEVAGVFEETADLVKRMGHDSIEFSISGYDYWRQTGWSDGASWKTDSQAGLAELLPAESRMIVYQYSPSPLATKVLSDSNAKITNSGVAEFNGVQCVELKVDGDSQSYYLNQDSHLLEGVVIPGLMKMTLSDYRAIEGVQFPGKRVVDISVIGLTLIYNFEETELNQAVDRRRTEKPVAIAQQEKPSLLVSMDKNADQKIDIEEYVLSRAKDPAGVVLTDFKALDANGDSFIDASEADSKAKLDQSQKNTNGGEVPATATAQQLVAMMDNNGDGKIAKDEAVEDVQVAFESLDANGDGFIDQSEAVVMANFANEQSGATAMKDAKGMADQGITPQQVISSMDTDGDNKISTDEANEQLRPHFGYIDTNYDGFVDQKEAQQIADYINNQ